jgi:hypothetical protein
VIGEDFRRRAENPGRHPSQRDLDRVLSSAVSIHVRPVIPGAPELFSSRDPSDLASLVEAFRIEGEMGHCMCIGSIAFRFEGRRGKISTVTLHHGVSLRWDPFFWNARLRDPNLILDWLSAHGIPEARQEYDDDRARAARSMEAARRWREVMPPALAPLWDSMLEPRAQWPEVARAMIDAYPNPVIRARVLLEWFGRGLGPWSGYPSYEGVPEWCLQQESFEVLVQAAQTEPRSSELLEGAARLFAHFWRTRPNDLARLPLQLKRELLDHALDGPIEDNRRRAFQAFRP